MLEPVIASADFSRESGRIRKSLHGSNAVPRMSNRNIYDFGPMYADMVKVLVHASGRKSFPSAI